MRHLTLKDTKKDLSRGFLNLDALPGGFKEFFEEYAGKRAGALIGLISYLLQSPLDDVTMYTMTQLRSMCQAYPDTVLEVGDTEDDRDEMGGE